ncbi:MAG: hypothetical protein LBV45_00340 [Xanthomonadaceae bacterium]|nr:hypothetical protein [Xanthomonadaceae bacterium]
MRIGWLVFALSVGMLSGCSCQKSPESADAKPSPIVDNATPNDAAALSPEEMEAKARHSRALANAVDAVQRYLNALAMRDQALADGFWSGGRPPSQPDDVVLRTALKDMQSIKIMSDAPVALDDQSPPQLLEVPVRLRIQTPSGLQRINGTYRLHIKPSTDTDPAKWEIVSASIQPELR